MEEEKTSGVHVLKVHPQVRILSECPGVVCVPVFRAQGTRFEELGVCGPQLFFRSLPLEVEECVCVLGRGGFERIDF